MRDLLGRFGACAPQPAADWTGDIALPDEIVRFYREVGPLGEREKRGFSGVTVPSHGNDFWFPPLARLWQEQSGYRWDGRTKERLAAWPHDWIVVADQGADPLVYDAASGTVSLLLHGAGSWEAGWAFSGTLTEVVGTIALFGALVEDAGADCYTPDFDLDPAWLTQATRTLTDRFSETGADFMRQMTAV